MSPAAAILEKPAAPTADRDGLAPGNLPPDFWLALQGVIMPRFAAVPSQFASGLLQTVCRWPSGSRKSSLASIRLSVNQILHKLQKYLL